MDVHTNHLASPDTLGDAKAQEAAEKAQRAERDRDCKGLRVLEWLQKRGRVLSARTSRIWNAVLAATPRLVEGHHKLRETCGRLEPRAQSKGSPGPFGCPEAKGAFRGRAKEASMPNIPRWGILLSSGLRRSKRGRGSCADPLQAEPRAPGLPDRESHWPASARGWRCEAVQPAAGASTDAVTIGGFLPHDATLNKGQLSEIELIAGGLARNPRTRTGMPVVTITGGFALGESASVGEARARAVKHALLDALKRIDLSLLQYVGFNLATNAWCSDVAIALRERIAPAPDPRVRISP